MIGKKRLPYYYCGINTEYLADMANHLSCVLTNGIMPFAKGITTIFICKPHFIASHRCASGDLHSTLSHFSCGKYNTITSTALTLYRRANYEINLQIIQLCATFRSESDTLLFPNSHSLSACKAFLGRCGSAGKKIYNANCDYN